MLERRHRLTARSGFSTTIRGGRRGATRTLVVHLLTGDPAVDPPCDRPGDRPGEAPFGPRVGLVVSRAVGDAVTRNRVKRRLRHLVRDRLASLPASATLVVRALPSSAAAGSPALGADLDRALRRAGLGGRVDRAGTVR